MDPDDIVAMGNAVGAAIAAQLPAAVALIAPAAAPPAAAPAAPPHRDGRKLTAFSEANSPAEWTTWRAKFEMVASIQAWEDLRQRQELFAAMSGSAAKAVSDLPVIDPDPLPVHAPPLLAYVPLTYKLVVASYEARFMTTAASDLARTEFQTCQQVPEETLLEWHGRVRDLFLQAYPGQDPNVVGVGSQLLIDRWVRGLDSDEIREGVLKERPTNFVKCLELAQNKLALLAMLADMGSTSNKKKAASIHFINYRGPNGGKKGSGTDNRNNSNNSSNREGKSCFLCEKTGHFQHECPLLAKAKSVIDRQAKRGAVAPQGRKKKWTPAVHAMEDEDEEEEARDIHKTSGN
jgi:hypothetical protein